MSSANAIQHGGTHYKQQAIQVWDYIAANNIGFLEGNAIKYLSRWKNKNGIQDLEKAKHYIEKLIELEEDRQGTEKKLCRQASPLLEKTVEELVDWVENQRDMTIDDELKFRELCGSVDEALNAARGE